MDCGVEWQLWIATLLKAYLLTISSNFEKNSICVFFINHGRQAIETENNSGIIFLEIFL